MFMTPREIKRQYSTHIGDRKKRSERFMSNEEMWDVKSMEAEERGLTSSVRETGVQHPIGLGTVTDTQVAAAHNVRAGPNGPKIRDTTGKPMITGGQHRVQAAYEADPDQLIPVLHHTDIHEHQGTRTPESHIEHETVTTEGGTKRRTPKILSQPGFERYATPKIAQPWGPYR
jgi:hypothetical protein